MKKSIWLAAGVAGMLLGNVTTDADAAVRRYIHTREGQSFVIESRPNFIMLPELGFSVAVGSPYDIVFYENRYFINRNGTWYRAKNYRGPWEFIRQNDLPSRIKKHPVEDIRRFRDDEYSRHDRGTRLEQRRSDENNKRELDQKRSDENNKRELDQKRSDENNKRELDQKRSDENNKRELDQKRSDENDKRALDQKRSDDNRR
ncbi:MAG: BcpO-related WXXGXW repeat protein [Chlorobiaceae bacterium]|nr:BcpO-related WXXGXW repeat protein [Chlorobiaceae bacterium]